MHVVASDLIAADLAAEFDWSSTEANQYLDNLLADNEEEWTSGLED